MTDRFSFSEKKMTVFGLGSSGGGVGTVEFLVRQGAIHKMTGKPAQKAGLVKRGAIAVGNHADIVVINPSEVEDHATSENPYQYPSGIPFVIVNGKLAVDQGDYTGTRAGTVLRRDGGFMEKFW